MRRWVTAIVVAAVLLAWTPLIRASVLSSLSTNLIMDCSVLQQVCNFDAGSRGSPEHGTADFVRIAPGWIATFDSDPAITWGIFFGEYIAEFGRGGAVSITEPGGLQFSGILTSGVAFRFPNGFEETVAWFQGRWSNGLYADGLMVGQVFDGDNSSAALVVNTYAPEPGSFFLFGSGLAGLAGMLRRRTVR